MPLNTNERNRWITTEAAYSNVLAKPSPTSLSRWGMNDVSVQNTETRKSTKSCPKTTKAVLAASTILSSQEFFGRVLSLSPARFDGMSLVICNSEKQHGVEECQASEAIVGHDGRRDPFARMWRYPSNPRIKVPYRVAAAVAVMEMGISEYSVIAEAVGLTIEEVERVDMAEDPAVKQLALARVPVGESFKLYRRVRCPKCQAQVGIAPCIACRGIKEN